MGGYFFNLGCILLTVSPLLDMTPKLTILLVDDHKLFCEGLEKLLMMFECVGAVHTAMCVEEAHLLIHHFRFDVALLDLQLSKSGWEGFDLCAHMRKEQPDAVVAVVSMFDDDYMVQRAKQCGARAFFNKNMEPEVLGDFLLHASVLHKDFFIDGRKQPNLPAEANQTINPIAAKTVKVMVSDFERVYYIDPDDIVSIEAANSQCYLHLREGCVHGSKLVISKSIKALSEQLCGNTFVQTHKSWIVNINHIKEQTRLDGPAFNMSNKQRVPLAKRLIKSVLQAVHRFFS